MAVLAEAYAALDRGDAPAAVQRFEAVCSQERFGAALEGLARAHYVGTGYRAAVVAHEDAYALYRREGDRLAAARVARMLAWITGNVFGEWAVRAGWIARARTLLADQHADSTERGWVLMLDARPSLTRPRGCSGTARRASSGVASAILRSRSRPSAGSASRRPWTATSTAGSGSSTRPSPPSWRARSTISTSWRARSAGCSASSRSDGSDVPGKQGDGARHPSADCGRCSAARSHV